MADVTLGSLGVVSCVSVHASPSMPKKNDLELWTGGHPRARTGGGRDAGRRWDSDYVLATLGLLATADPTLAAGDFNECRGWDLAHPGETWGAEYFEAVEAKQLVDCLDKLWGDEVATRDGYQLDHVLATAGVASAVVDATVIDMPLADPQHVPSDHRPVEFVIDVS